MTTSNEFPVVEGIHPSGRKAVIYASIDSNFFTWEVNGKRDWNTTIQKCKDEIRLNAFDKLLLRHEAELSKGRWKWKVVSELYKNVQ